MANVIDLIAGSQSTYASAGFTATDFNSLAVGSTAIASTAINNRTNNDLLADVSFSFVNGSSATTAGASFISLFLLPLNQDGTTYGDNIGVGGSGAIAAIPGTNYWVRNCLFGKSVGSGGTLVGTFVGIWLPRKSFVLAIANVNLVGALNASASATVQFDTTNYNGNGP